MEVGEAVPYYAMVTQVSALVKKIMEGEDATDVSKVMGILWKVAQAVGAIWWGVRAQTVTPLRGNVRVKRE